MSVDHSERAHALLSSSGASRWFNCPPSARMSDLFEETGSDEADEGTLAHELADLELQYGLNLIDVAEYERQSAKLKERPHFSSLMAEPVSIYVDFCLEKYSELLAADPETTAVHIEMKVDLSKFVPESFGTCDFVIFNRYITVVIDLKYGEGIPVTAVDNPQLKLYALGALEFQGLKENRPVELVIVQPRLESISTFSTTQKELYYWGTVEIPPVAQLAFDGEGEIRSGYWCIFCKCKPRCKKLTEYMNSEDATFEEHPHLMSDAELLKARQGIKSFKQWAGSVDKYLIEQSLNKGKSWPGLKVVRTKGRRKWKNSAAALKLLYAEGFLPEEVENLKIKGIGQIQKLMSVDKFKNTLGGFIETPLGKPILVPLSDERPSMIEDDLKRVFGIE